MAKISLVIAIIVTLATAGLAYVTRTKIDDLQKVLARTKQTLKTTEATLAETKKNLETRTQELEAANKTIEERNSEISMLKTELTTAKGDLEKAVADIKAKEAMIAEKEVEITKLKEANPGMTAEQIAAQKAQMEAEIAKLRTELAEAKQVAETLTARVQSVEGQLTSVTADRKRYIDVTAKQGLAGRVVAVNPGWNFVVVDVGDRQGAMINAPLLVMRGGSPVARLKITSVEPSSSIADIVPGTITRGESVQPGDRVVFARQTTLEVPPNPAAGGAPAPGVAPAGGGQ